MIKNAIVFRCGPPCLKKMAQTRLWRHIWQFKVPEINNKQTESEDSNDSDLDLDLDSDGQIEPFIFEPQYSSSSEEEEGEEQEFNSHRKWKYRGRSYLLVV